MLKRKLSEATKRTRDGLVTYFLLQIGDIPSNSLSASWVEIESKHKQQPHYHLAEQVYVIIKGKGNMQVGDEYFKVEAGELIFIPSNAMHGIKNTGSGKLVYVSVSTPAFNVEALYDTGLLRQESNA